MSILPIHSRIVPLALIALLGFASGAWAGPSPDKTVAYGYNCVPAMPVVSSGTTKSLAVSNTLTQTFIPRPDAFLSALNRQDSNGVHTVAVSGLSLKLSGYQKGSSTFNVAISRVETNGGRTLLCSQNFLQGVYGQTVRTWTFSNSCLVDFDAQHELAVTLLQGGTNYYGTNIVGVDLFTPATDYPEGACSAGSDLWFALNGSSGIPVFTNLQVAAISTNAYFFDTSTNQDLTRYDNLKGKFLGVNGHPEQLKFTCPVAWAPAFSIADTNLASLQVQTSTGASTVTNTVTLNGLAEGETMLLAKSGGTVVGYWKLQCHPRRTIKLSYTYVRFPTELPNPANSLYDAYPGIANFISSNYAKMNVAIIWTNNGVLTYNWDLNGDGHSDAEYDEMWSPMDAGILPNIEKFFSNLYARRDRTGTNYNTDYRGAGQGGTSRGFGLGDAPPRGAVLGANYFTGSPTTIGQTLGHELGHNLGLSHVADNGAPATDNMMDVGGYADNLWSWQWAVVHNTLATLYDVPPAVALTAPTDGASFLPSATVNLSATILTNRNPISRVEFYSAGTNLLGFDTNAPYTLAWTNVAAGNYPLTAVVYDNQWMVSTSAVASITVGSAPPVVALTAPVSNAVLNSNLVTLAAAVTNNGNPINKVEFLAGAAVIGTVLNAPYNFTWSGMAAGNYTVKARAWYGPATATVDSTAAAILVNGAPAFTNSLLNFPAAVAGTAYVGNLSGTASDPNAGQARTFSKVSGPVWLLVAANGNLTGTPAASNEGVNDFTVRVTDPYGLAGDATLRLTVTVPAPMTASLGWQGANLLLAWSGGIPPYQVQSATNLVDPVWTDVGSPTSNQSAVMTPGPLPQFYRIRGQ